MSQPPLNNSGARYWNDLVEEFDFSPDEKREIREGADHMIAEVRARRLAEVRKRQKATQDKRCNHTCDRDRSSAARSGPE